MKEACKIRDAEISDVDRIYCLIEEVAKIHAVSRKDIFREDAVTITKDRVIERVTGKKYCVKVVEYRKEVIGIAMVKIIEYIEDIKYKDIKFLQMEEIVFDEKYRGLGFGKILMEDIKCYAKKNNCKFILSNVWEFNEQSKAFFRKCGFQKRNITLELEV